MSTTSIEWTDKTWNPLVGCSVISPGCTNCYAMKMARRLERIADAHADKDENDLPGPLGHYQGTTRDTKAGPVWTGLVRPASRQIMLAPMYWKKPTRIFVNSMSDLFHEAVPDKLIDTVFAVMALSPQHTFQVLTKRADRMHAYLSAARAHPVGLEAMELTLQAMAATPTSQIGSGVMLKGDIVHLSNWPLPNVWLGVSAEDQQRAAERIAILMQTPAARRFVSAEPLLSPLTLTDLCNGSYFYNALTGARWTDPPEGERGASDTIAKIDWVIVGGKWTFGKENMANTDGHRDDEPDLYRVGKKEAGAHLDGELYREFPA